MNWKDLEKRVASAQQKLQEMELRALNAERVAKTAKAKAQQLKLEHRRAKKMAKEAKRYAAVVAEEAREQCRVLEEAERRLAKALKRARARQRHLRKAPAGATARAAPPAKPALPKVLPSRGGAVPAGAHRATGNGQQSQASAYTPKDVTGL